MGAKMRNLEKETEKDLLKIKGRVRRSRLDYWDKMLCYEAIRNLAKYLLGRYGVGETD